MLYIKHIDLIRLGTDSGAADFLRSAHATDPAIAKIFAKKSKKINFFAKIGPDMHETKCRGARDLSVVKFSAPYDACRSTKRRKNETEKFRKIANFERPFTPETMLRLASNFGKMRFRRSPTCHVSTSNKKKSQKFWCENSVFQGLRV